MPKFQVTCNLCPIPVLFGSAIDDVSSALRPGSLTMESLISPGNDDSSLPNSCDVLAKLEAIHRDHSSPMMEDLIPVSFIYPRIDQKVKMKQEPVEVSFKYLTAGESLLAKVRLGIIAIGVYAFVVRQLFEWCRESRFVGVSDACQSCEQRIK